MLILTSETLLMIFILSSKHTRKTEKKRSTPQENKLWSHLKHKALGHQFIRQFTHGPYMVDFCCVEKKLVVEIDGWKRKGTSELDKARAEYFSDFNFIVLRFWNNEIDENIESVLHKIQAALR